MTSDEMTEHPPRLDHNIWPGIASPHPHALRSWLVQLGFEEGGCYLDEDGTSVRHSEMLWPQGGRVMISSAGKLGGDDASAFRSPPGGAMIYVVVDDPDPVWSAAQELNVTVVRPMRDEDYGSRGFSIADEDGNVWSFGTYAGRSIASE